MASVFVLDTPENRPFVAVAGQDARVTLGRLGPYLRIETADEVEVDRRATGCRHAVWYSAIAGLDGLRIEQWDKDAFRAVPR
ncbi:hypothetical protein [Aeromicrobium sp.]|uniref:hypothetical protein n=1 Tax=Aeromicrobium sp. TaxID=1871063 RepID=UPI0028A91376|nr:hypothetical protein [Aeromicrobium sp.]